MSVVSRQGKSVVKLTKLQALDLIRAPVITEKATMALEHNQVTFQVPLGADKLAIKQAIEDVFQVKVLAVNTIVQKGKRKRFRGRVGRRSDRKKAIVSLAEGHQIDLTAGI